MTPPSVEIRKPTPGASVACWPLLTPPVAAMMIDWLGSWFLGKMVMLAMLMAALGAEVGQGDPGRPAGAGREEVGRLPDAAAGAADVDRVARGVGGIHGDGVDLAGLVGARGRADRRPGLARQGSRSGSG